jgi:hypothetical protein
LRANRQKLALSGNGSKHVRKKLDLIISTYLQTREWLAQQGQSIISADTRLI